MTELLSSCVISLAGVSLLGKKDGWCNGMDMVNSTPGTYGGGCPGFQRIFFGCPPVLIFSKCSQIVH